MTGKDHLGWKQKRTPKRGTRRARNWRRIYPGYTFPDSAWTVTEAPYKRIRRDKSKDPEIDLSSLSTEELRAFHKMLKKVTGEEPDQKAVAVLDVISEG